MNPFYSGINKNQRLSVGYKTEDAKQDSSYEFGVQKINLGEDRDLGANREQI